VFGAGQQPVDTQAERQLVSATIEAIVVEVDPRLRLHWRYRDKLDDCVRHTIAYLRSMARERLKPVRLTREAWSDDRRVNAFFGTADDVSDCLGRSPELRAFLEDPGNPGVQEPYALLAMKKEERSVSGVSFSGHRLAAPSPTLAAMRLELGRRVILHLAQVAQSRIVAADAKATELQQTVAGSIEATASLATLDGYIGHVEDVFSHPERHVRLTHTALGISDLSFAELSTGEGWRAAIAIVRCPRAVLPPREGLVAHAERSL
jgi:hypothetical protein